jgi:hypothetical protein
VALSLMAHTTEQVFKERPVGNPHHYTAPQPFHFAHDSSALEEKRYQAVLAARRREQEQCTFRPETNEAYNRQLLSRILGGDSRASAMS